MSDAAAELAHHRRGARARARRLLRRLPRRAHLRRWPLLRHLADWALRRPELWRYRAPQMTRAFYIGAVLTFLPFGGIQLFLAVLACLLFGANIPIAAALQFVSNPLTAAPMYIGTYQLGKWLVGLVGVQPEGWLGGAALYLGVGGLAAGVALGLVLDGVARLLVALGSRRQRALSALVSAQDTAS